MFHTKGPWAYIDEPEQPGVQYCITRPGDELGVYEIASVPYSSNAEADAALITQAPELIAIVQRVANILPGIHIHGTQEIQREIDMLIFDANEVLKKARGEDE